jgi:TolB-like protein
MRVFALQVGLPAQPKTAAPGPPAAPPPPPKKRQMMPLVAGIVVALLLIAGAAWYFLAGQEQATVVANAPAHFSIVVLPFANLSNDPKQDYLADVLTDELTTYLSRIPSSFVIARSTALTYKGKATDVKQIGKDLDVRYALEGSVQPTDKRIRTNAQLIDTETGAHLWAEEFDTDKTDLLQTEDEIVTRLARTLEIQLTSRNILPSASVQDSNSGGNLEQRFTAANTTHDGCLTRQQAIEGVGLKGILRDFAAIDVARSGCVTLDQIRQFRLSSKFATANATHDGCLTRQQAIDGGMKQIARYFDEIDRSRRGCITLEQVQRFVPPEPVTANRFAAANTTHDGCLTHDQAVRGGFKSVVQNFSQIDKSERGCITLDQMRTFIEQPNMQRRPSTNEKGGLP